MQNEMPNICMDTSSHISFFYLQLFKIQCWIRVDKWVGFPTSSKLIDLKRWCLKSQFFTFVILAVKLQNLETGWRQLCSTAFAFDSSPVVNLDCSRGSWFSQLSSSHLWIFHMSVRVSCSYAEVYRSYLLVRDFTRFQVSI